MKVRDAFAMTCTLAAIALLVDACGSGTVHQSLPNDIAIQCDKPMLRHGNPVEPQESACEVKLVSQSAALACDQAEAAAGFTLVGFDLSNGKENDAAVSNQPSAGSCDLRVPSGYGGGLISDARPTNAITIADFTPVSGDATILIANQCGTSIGQPPCVFVRIGTDESYQCLEDRVSNSAGEVLAQGSYANQHFPAPTLNIGSPNRLVVQLKRGKLVAYLNTRLVCAVNVTAGPAKAPVDFLVFAKTDSAITVTTLIVGEAS